MFENGGALVRRQTGQQGQEGPVFAPDGNLYCVDIPNGRVLRVDPAGTWSLVCRYDGWPNGMKLLPDGHLPGADAVWVMNRKAEAVAQYVFPDDAFPTNIAME